MYPWIADEEKPYLPAEKVAYTQIRQRILDGRLCPGDRLLLRGLAAELGISQIPVVVALRMLERDGFVVNIPGRGSCVRMWSRDDMIDLYSIRAVLEGLGARLCAERATQQEIGAIVVANEAFIEATEAEDWSAQIQADMDFHMTLIKGAHSTDLQRMTYNGSIIQCSLRQFGISLRVPLMVHQEYKHTHGPIVAAVMNRDPVSAEASGREHVEASLSRNLAWIEEIVAAMIDGQASRISSGNCGGGNGVAASGHV